MNTKTKTYLIGMPQPTREKLTRLGKNLGLTALLAVAGAACFVVGYLIGLTCFYYG